MKKYEVHMDALDAMRGLLNATSSQREALHMSAEDAAEEFSVDGLLMTDRAPEVAEAQPAAAVTEPAPAPANDDPWNVP